MDNRAEGMIVRTGESEKPTATIAAKMGIFTILKVNSYALTV